MPEYYDSYLAGFHSICPKLQRFIIKHISNSNQEFLIKFSQDLFAAYLFIRTLFIIEQNNA